MSDSAGAPVQEAQHDLFLGDRGDGTSRGGGGSNSSHAAPKMLGGLMLITCVNDVYNVYKMDVISDALSP